MKRLLNFLRPFRTHKLGRRRITTIKIIYKSGATHEFDVYTFEITRSYGGDTSMKWEAVSDDNKPLLIGVDEIAAVYQGKERYKYGLIEK